ncbi:uncharacterized protein ATC70_001705 [Mucor velutinosus]|uniref:Uncharacterized protein n=1 Tax=Mucor velutinosus TaxID=708070 RepID=A0AAN7DJW3_9FUNG|nr:hypothetical protein ATC70_001705 [Mucor velutinosus]
MHNDLYTNDELAYVEGFVDAFVDAQLQIIHRVTQLDKYNTTQRQSLISLEDGGIHEIIAQKELISITDKTYQALLATYNHDKLALIIQGLGATGSLLPAAFSLPTNLSDTSIKHIKQRVSAGNQSSLSKETK